MCYSANYLIVHLHIYTCAFYKMLQYNIWQINCAKWPETVSFIKFSGINPNNCLLYFASCVGGLNCRAQCTAQAGLSDNDVCLVFALLIKTLMVTSLAFLLLWLCGIWCDTVSSLNSYTSRLYYFQGRKTCTDHPINVLNIVQRSSSMFLT